MDRVRFLIRVLYDCNLQRMRLLDWKLWLDKNRIWRGDSVELLAKFNIPRNYKDGTIMWPSQLNDKYLRFDTLPDCGGQTTDWQTFRRRLLKPRFAVYCAVKRLSFSQTSSLLRWLLSPAPSTQSFPLRVQRMAPRLLDA